MEPDVSGGDLDPLARLQRATERAVTRQFERDRPRPHSELLVTHLPETPLTYLGVAGAGYFRFTTTELRGLIDQLDGLLIEALAYE